MDISQYFLLASRSPLLLPKIRNTQKKKSSHKKSIVKRQVVPVSSLYKLSSNEIIRGSTTQKSNKVIRSTMRTTTFLPSEKDTEYRPKKIGSYFVGKEIGKGGFAKVYECTDSEGISYAIKQYCLQNGHQCFENQIIVGKRFFGKGQAFGPLNLIRFVQRMRIGKKGYIVQELGGSNFSKMLSEIQGVFHNNQRVYEVNFKPFYQSLTAQNKLKEIFLQVCKAVQVLNNEGFIHCDLKSQNILINNETITDKPIVKLIDFGSTFELCKGVPKITITPQYMPPQLLNYLNNDLQSQSRMDRIDVWSLGCILLEVLTGVPLWFKYKCKITYRGRTNLQLGYFALANRDYTKLMRKQKELSQNIRNIIFTAPEFQKFRPILKHTLEYDPSKRLSINQLVEKVQFLQ